MPLDFLIKAPTAIFPAVIFLLVLHQLDAFHLCDKWQLLRAALVGALMAGASYIISGRTLDGLPIGFTDYSQYIAPIIEEALKAGFMVYLFTRNRIGFMIDAAILGFALGAGFAVCENLYYLYLVPDANFGVWIVRGFGTAVMHGGATAIFAMLSQSLMERRGRAGVLLYAPGLLAAIALHMAFNHFPNQPLLAMCGVLIIVPTSLLALFAKSVHAADRWLLDDYQSHEHVLAELDAAEGTCGGAARLIGSIDSAFDGAVTADVFSYLKLHDALVAQAESMLLAQERGETVAAPEGLQAQFEQMHALERRIGKAAMLSLWPHLRFSRRELWELYRLERRPHGFAPVRLLRDLHWSGRRAA